MQKRKKRRLLFYVAVILWVNLMVILIVMLVRLISSDSDSSGKSDVYADSSSISDLDVPVLNEVTNVAKGVKITWEAVSGAEKYRVYYKTDSDGWTKIKDVTDTSYTWTGAESGTNYTFTVRCISSDGKSTTSDYDRTGMSITYIAAPQISDVTNAATGVKITWEAVSGAEKYRVFYKTDSGSWTKIKDVTKTSYTWTGAESGTEYTFTVRCVSNDGKSYISSYDKTGMSITYIAAPQLSDVTNVANGVKITWEAVSGAEKYRVFYKTGSDSWKRIEDVTDTSYIWTEGQSGTEYTFTVRCVSSDGKSYTSSYDKTGKSITYSVSH